MLIYQQFKRIVYYVSGNWDASIADLGTWGNSIEDSYFAFAKSSFKLN
jgi:hypothetical protein